mgnify:CR=1 FL=1
MVVTGFTNTLHAIFFAREGSLVTACRLPWPVYVAAGWFFIDEVITRTRTRLIGAVEAVGRGARSLEPRIVTGANTVKTALSVPLFLLFLDSIGVTLSAVWGLLGSGGHLQDRCQSEGVDS